MSMLEPLLLTIYSFFAFVPWLFFLIFGDLPSVLPVGFYQKSHIVLYQKPLGQRFRDVPMPAIPGALLLLASG